MLRELAENEGFCCGLASDVLDAMDYRDAMLCREFVPNFPLARMIGQARTIQLRALREGDDPADVNGALALMDVVNEGDVIVVAGGSMEWAYWGDIMTKAATLRGAVGNIIDGLTRDTAYTIRANYPVFARGFYGRDINTRGIVEAFDVPVEIDGHVIEPKQWVYGDIDGVAIIPVGLEQEFVFRANEKICEEEQVRLALERGKKPTDLLKAGGVF